MNIINLVNRFKTQEECVKHLEMIRWSGIPKCAYCGTTNVWKHHDNRNYTCNKCNNGFSVTVGTLFHDSKLPLLKWFMAISLITNARKGISACQLMRDLEIGSYKTAWRMLRLIRKAMVDTDMKKYFQDIVEIDETYIGGKPHRNFHLKSKAKRGRGTNKQPVVGVVDRENKKVHAEVATPNEAGQKLTGKQLLDILNRVTRQCLKSSFSERI